MPIWARITAAAVVVVGAGLAGYFLLLMPVLAGSDIAARLSVEFAYDQLVGVVLAIVLTVIFGRIAVGQLELARAEAERARLAREQERQAETRRVLLAMYNELHHNWQVALTHEGRLRQSPDLLMKTSPQFRRTVFDAALAGPLWAVPEGERVYPAIGDAYWAIETLSLSLAPRVKFRSMVAAVAVTATLQTGPAQKYAVSALAALAYYAVEVLWRAFAAQRAGKPTRTRIAIEGAMGAIHLVVFGKPLQLADLIAALPPEVKVVAREPSNKLNVPGDRHQH
jgi:hypothetical protein